MIDNNIFYHSGSFGDIIYSIPFCLSTIGIYNFSQLQKNNYTLLIDLCCCHKKNINDEFAFDSLKKVANLLQIQPYIKQVLCQKRIPWGDYGALDLGIIRKGRVNMSAGDISLRYHFLKRQLKYFNINQPWLKIPQTNKFDYFKDKIIIFRSPRYRNPKVCYAPLRQYSKKCIYIGLEKEYSLFCIQSGFKPQFIKIDSFIDACQMMKRCAFVVGNQTFFFSLAQALKIPRMCEMCFNCPDVIVHGDYANDFVDTQDLSHLIKMYYNKFVGD